MPDRYVVREIEGYLRDTNGKGLPGLSCVVLDSRVNYRLVKEFQSESADAKGSRYALTRDEARARTRAQAAELAARMNEAHP